MPGEAMGDMQTKGVTRPASGGECAGGPFCEELQLTLTSDPAAVRLTLGRLTAKLMREGVDADTAGKAELVLAEVLNNVVEHALEGRKGGMIGLTVLVDGDRIAVEVSDEGAPMPGQSLPAGEVARAGMATSDLPEGGFGWPLIRQLAADIAYERVGGRNVLRFSMDLPVSGAARR